MVVFSIGFNRCGTQSLHKMFMDNGYESIHWDWGKAEDTMKENHKVGNPLLTGYETATLFSDIDFLTRHFVLFAEQYPELKVERTFTKPMAGLLMRVIGEVNGNTTTLC